MPVTGLILAGGQGRRMGGVDKGLQTLHGKPLVAWVLERLAPQVSEILISANQNLDRYGSFGHRVLPDEVGGFAGPLAGLERAMQAATHDFIVTAPCDSPLLPADLVHRLQEAQATRGADLAVARTGLQVHPVFCLCKRSLHSHLRAYLAGGGRKIDTWYSELAVIEVPFDDEAAAFSNINTVEELKDHEQMTGLRNTTARPG
ncbi:MAG: molybdenum cofactor guanylyltransferase [Betaproteobacteria bacterium]|nr:MAG: molybdenum cofactor guanylyltransferase [Betaproteobacteria bacterium]